MHVLGNNIYWIGGYLRSEDGVVCLWHFSVNLHIYSSSIYLAAYFFLQVLISATRHLRVELHKIEVLLIVSTLLVVKAKNAYGNATIFVFHHK